MDCRLGVSPLFFQPSPNTSRLTELWFILAVGNAGLLDIEGLDEFLPQGVIHAQHRLTLAAALASVFV